MNKQFLINVIVGSLAITAAAAITGCGPEDAKTAASATTAANKGHEVCTDEVVTLTRPAKDKDQIAGTVAGAVIGGVLGNKVGGKGDSQTVATVAGAAAGGYAGNKIQENAQEKNTYQETKRTCRMVYN
jgi:uncharacterized protein YcfJ